MRAFLLALLMGSALAACTMPGAPDDATRLETGAGERANAGDAREASDPARENGGAPAASTEPPAQVPPAQGAKPGAASPEPSATDDAPPPMSDPLPAEAAPGPASALAPNRSCRTSADCVVKNVGSCCGAMPACVNANAKTDPAAVQAQCARQGMSSVCGFKEITSCSCVAGTCQDGGEAVAQ